MNNLSELFPEAGYSAPATAKGMEGIITARSPVAAANANLDAVANIEKATVAQADAQAGVDGTYIQQQKVLDAQQLEARKAVNASLSSLFQKTDAVITENINAGLDATMRATEAKKEVAKLAEEQNQTWNPLKKFVLLWKRDNVASTAINAATEASAYFETAKTAGDVTAQQMQQTISRDAMSGGLERQLSQQKLSLDMQRTAQEQAIFTERTDAIRSGVSRLYAAKLSVFSAQDFEQRRAEAERQAKLQQRELNTQDAMVRHWLVLNGNQPLTEQSRAAALGYLQAMNPEERQVFSRSMIFARDGGVRGVLNGLTVPEAQSLGKFIPALKDFGNGIYADRQRQVTDQLLVQEYAKYKAGVTQGRPLDFSSWKGSKDGAASVKLAQEQAKGAVDGEFRNLPAKDLLGYINPGVSMPASFDLGSAVSTFDGRVFSASGHLSPAQAAVLANAYKPGAPGFVVYKSEMANMLSRLNADEVGPHVQVAALATSLMKTGAAKNEKVAYEMASAAMQTAALSVPRTDDTSRLFESAGFSSQLKPTVPVKVDGLSFDMTNPVDAAKVGKILARKTEPSFFEKVGNALTPDRSGVSTPSYSAATVPVQAPKLQVPSLPATSSDAFVGGPTKNLWEK